jgi:hypothetical protein
VSSVGELTLLSRLNGPGSFSQSGGMLIWHSGTISGFKTNFAVNAPLIIRGVGLQFKTLDDTTLVLAYPTTWEAGNVDLTNNAKIQNYGIFTILSSFQLGTGVANTSFENLSGPLGRGLVIKNGGGGDTICILPVVNSGDLQLNGYNIDFRNGLRQEGTGSTILGGGILNLGIGGVFTMLGGTLTGGGTIDDHLTVNGGTVIIGPTNSLTVLGNYSQGAGATLRVQYDNAWGILHVEGTATLAGLLAVEVLAGDPGNDWAEIITSTQGLAGGFTEPIPGWDVDYLLGANGYVRIKKQ